METITLAELLAAESPLMVLIGYLVMKEHQRAKKEKNGGAPVSKDDLVRLEKKVDEMAADYRDRRKTNDQRIRELETEVAVLKDRQGR